MRPEDELVNLLSRWLARHVGNDDVLRRIDELGTEEMSPDHAEAVDELREALENAGGSGRGGVEVAVRETLEALAMG